MQGNNSKNASSAVLGHRKVGKTKQRALTFLFFNCSGQNFTVGIKKGILEEFLMEKFRSQKADGFKLIT